MVLIAYPYSNTETLKSLPILDIWNRYVGLELRKQGTRYAVRCPWHSGGNEKTPSLFLNPTKNTFKCFGCDVGGSNIDLAMQALSLDFKEACRALALDFGIEWDRPPTKEERAKAQEAAQKRELVKSFRNWCDNTYIELCVLYRCINKVIYNDPAQAEVIPDMLKLEPLLEYWLNILQYGTDEERFSLFRCEAVKKWLIPLT